MRTSTRAAFTAALAVALSACGADKQAKDANQALSDLTKAVTDMAQQGEKLAGAAAGLTTTTTDAKPVPPVSFKQLIEYLPKSLDGLKASEPEGETTTMGQWQYSQANVRFSNGEGVSADVGVFDYAHISMLYLPFQAALRMKIQQESTKGYQRSVEIDGFPALEEWNKNDKSSELTVLVGNRFVVSAKVRGGDEKSARQVIDKIDLKGLSKESAN